MKTFENKILLIFAHPALQNSRVNAQLIEYVKDLDGVTFLDLYEEYPDFNIDVTHEQNLLTEHDIVIFHHPLLWFSVPALIREWMDLVFQHMWAYGKTGNALQGKKLFNVVTVGGGEKLFRHGETHGNTLVEFLAPIRQSVRMCGMDFLPPFGVYGTRTITKNEIEMHGQEYKRLLLALRDGKLDIDAARSLPHINSDLENLITT